MFDLLLRNPLGTHRFQRAVSAKDALLGARPVYASLQVRGRMNPIDRSFAETARWKRCVPRGDFQSHLSAAIGSTLVARRAGSQHANNATPISSSVVTPNVKGSTALTP